MRTPNLLLIVLLVVLITSLSAVWFYPSAMDFMASNNRWNGLLNFTNSYGAKQVQSLDELLNVPGSTVLVSIPRIPYTQDELATLNQFVTEGGTLVLMDDFGFGNTVLEYLGLPARFDQKELLDPLFCYRNQYFPKITDFSDDVAAKGVKAIIMNHGSVLDNVPPDNVIARSSEMSFLDIKRDGNWSQGEPRGPLVVAAEFPLGQGLVELVSDPSIVINSMTSENDNAKFMDYLFNRKGKLDNILIDNSHLTHSVLDWSKIRLSVIRQTLSSPYALAGLSALLITLMTLLLHRKGTTIG